MTAHGEKVGALQVLLYRPFSAVHFLAALPATVKSIGMSTGARNRRNG